MAQLWYVSSARPGIRRVRRGRTVHYLDPDGRRVRDLPTLRRIRALAIPPAWTDVWICPVAHGHVQATGRDARGRKQYRYHARWRAHRDGDKFARMLAFGRALGRIPATAREAVQVLEKATQLAPANAATFAELAVVLARQGLRLRAQKALETAQRLAPRDARIARLASELGLGHP